MKNLKKAVYIGLVLSIAGLMCLQAGATNLVNSTDNLKENKLVFNGAEKMPLTATTYHNIGTVSSGGNVLLSSDSPENDHLPDITRDVSGNIIVTYTHEVSMLEATSYIVYSHDNGESWNSIPLTGFEGLCTYSQVARMQGSNYEGGSWDGIWFENRELTADTGYFVMISDITSDPGSWDAYQWVEGNQPGSSCLNVEDDMYYKEFAFDQAPGPVTAQINDDQGMDQGIMLDWIAEDLSTVSNWDSGTGPEGMYFPASDIDTAPIHDSDPAWTDNDFFYVVCQSDYTDKSSVLYKRCVPTIQDDIEFADDSYFLDGGDTYDAAHPAVAASGDNVVVVYMTDENGDWDVKCKYSADHGTTWNSDMIAAASGADETYPAIYMSGSDVYVAYIKEGNLYTVESEDGGATWGDPAQVNDVDGTVVAEENSVVIHPAGIVWTDDRDGNNDIYFSNGGAGPAPIISVKSISGGFGISAVIQNTGTADATGVTWGITIGAPLMILGGETTGTIDVPAGGQVTVKSGFVLGFGPCTITVTAGDSSKTASGTVLGPFVIGL